METPECPKTQRSIVGKFKLGLKKAWSIRIWESVESHVAKSLAVKIDDLTHEQIAGAIGCARLVVTNGLNHGSLELENLVLLISQFDWDFRRDLPDMPDRESRCLSGYLEAIAYIRSEMLGQSDDERITPGALLSLWVVLSDWEYLRQAANDTPDEQMWESILMRLRPVIARKIHVPEEQIPYHSPSDLMRLHRKWGKAVAMCLQAIPYNWMEVDP